MFDAVARIIPVVICTHTKNVVPLRVYLLRKKSQRKKSQYEESFQIRYYR